MPPLPWYPPTVAAWVTSTAGMLALLVSLWAQSRMWQVEFGLRSVAAGGGEYMVALFLGVPTLLLALVLLGVSATR